ncbi:hypothetical protein VT84_22760 [Gemmata sp. SH-PL17]|uniref:hypothetical protein n=1 Tax=Gemmata sp. SH-PL17 TaxID=1630693 RepID=UPI0004BBEE85|nr:hypothetical protein [Gemmata sp. SH-PL17]AMV27241.1 hypothetical protein VT84_22760 [Gemmata sp. SH-PL17]
MTDLAVHWDGQRVGRIVVSQRDGNCVFGRFVPEAGFEVCRGAFEEAHQGDEEYQREVARTGDVFADRERFYAAVAALTARISLPETGREVEEFHVFADDTVEIYLYAPDN